jgi:hypothetical protein
MGIRLKSMFSKEILLVIIIAIATLAVAVGITLLHPHKRNQAAFADNTILSSDLKGSYEDGVDDVVIKGFTGQSNINADYYQIDLSRSSRSVSIRFGDAHWKDEDLADVSPGLPSQAYNIILLIGLREGSILQAKVGEHYKPFLYIIFIGPYQAFHMMVRDLMPEGKTVPPEPPLELYNKGHADFILEDQNKWVLDVDAWFRDSFTKDYVELSFAVTCSLGS